MSGPGWTLDKKDGDAWMVTSNATNALRKGCYQDQQVQNPDHFQCLGQFKYNIKKIICSCFRLHPPLKTCLSDAWWPGAEKYVSRGLYVPHITEWPTWDQIDLAGNRPLLCYVLKTILDGPRCSRCGWPDQGGHNAPMAVTDPGMPAVMPPCHHATLLPWWRCQRPVQVLKFATTE